MSAEEQHRDGHLSSVSGRWQCRFTRPAARRAGGSRTAAHPPATHGGLCGQLSEVGILDDLGRRAGAGHQVAHRLRRAVREAVRALGPVGSARRRPRPTGARRRACGASVVPGARSAAPPTRGESGTPSTPRAEARRRWRRASPAGTSRLELARPPDHRPQGPSPSHPSRCSSSAHRATYAWAHGRALRGLPLRPRLILPQPARDTSEGTSPARRSSTSTRSSRTSRSRPKSAAATRCLRRSSSRPLRDAQASGRTRSSSPTTRA